MVGTGKIVERIIAIFIALAVLAEAFPNILPEPPSQGRLAILLDHRFEIYWLSFVSLPVLCIWAAEGRWNWSRWLGWLFLAGLGAVAILGY